MADTKPISKNAMPGAMPPMPGAQPPLAPPRPMPPAMAPPPAAPIQEKGMAGGIGGGALGMMAGGPLGALAGAGLGTIGQDAIEPGGVLNNKAAPVPMIKSEGTTMTDVDLAKSVADIADVMKAIVPAMKALNENQASLRSELASIRKELPIKDGAKYAKDDEHDATTDAQGTQVHEAAPEAAVKTFKPENKVEGAFAPKLKAVEPTKTVNLEALVNKAVEARLAKSMPAISATPAPPATAAKPTGSPAGEPAWKSVMKAIVDNDRKLHGVYAKNSEGIDTGYRAGDETVKVQSAKFVAKMRKDLGA